MFWAIFLFCHRRNTFRPFSLSCVHMTAPAAELCERMQYMCDRRFTASYRKPLAKRIIIVTDGVCFSLQCVVRGQFHAPICTQSGGYFFCAIFCEPIENNTPLFAQHNRRGTCKCHLTATFGTVSTLLPDESSASMSRDPNRCEEMIDAS